MKQALKPPRATDSMLDERIDSGNSVVVETVLSSDKWEPLNIAFFASNGSG
jgi:hypothetical protein